MNPAAAEAMSAMLAAAVPGMNFTDPLGSADPLNTALRVRSMCPRCLRTGTPRQPTAANPRASSYLSSRTRMLPIRAATTMTTSNRTG